MPGWSDAFEAALSSPAVALMWRVESWRIGTGPGREGWQAASCQAASTGGAWDRLVLPPRITGSTVTPQSWRCSVGAAQVVVAAPSACHQWLVRGSFLRIYVGVVGLGGGAAGMELAWAGMVDTITQRGGLVQIDGLDLFAALKSRITRTALELELFYNASGATTVKAGSPYVAGDTTLHVTSTAGFERQSGGNGAVKVVPDSGDAFYLRWSASTGTTLTVESTAFHGTVAGAASAGQAVTEVALLEGHPIDIARRVLTSTGTGSNGTHDVYPGGWGLGIPWAAIDDTDIARTKLRASGVSGMDWSVLVEGEVTDGLGWLAGLLETGGLVLAMCQGRITVRAVEDLATPTAYRTWEVSEDDVVRGSEWEYSAYADDVSLEYSDLSVRSSSAASTLPSTVYVDTLPAGDYLTYDLSAVLLGSAVSQLTAVSDRMALGATQIPEVLRVRVPLAYAGATVLDRVRLRGWSIVGRHGDISDSVGVITSVSPDWSAGVVDMTIHLWRPDL